MPVLFVSLQGKTVIIYFYALYQGNMSKLEQVMQATDGFDISQTSMNIFTIGFPCLITLCSYIGMACFDHCCLLKNNLNIYLSGYAEILVTKGNQSPGPSEMVLCLKILMLGCTHGCISYTGEWIYNLLKVKSYVHIVLQAYP